MSEFTFKYRREEGGTPALEQWGINSEYGVLREVLVGPADHFKWLQTSAISKRSIRLGWEFDAQVAKAQHAELLAAFKDAGVEVHILSADPKLHYQIFARDSSVMTPWGPIITQMGHVWRRGEYAPAIKFYEQMQIPIYDMITAGSFEGGDFQVLEPGIIFCGYSDAERTKKDAFEQMKGWIEKEGWEVKGYQFDPYFVHSDIFLVMLAEKLALMCVEVVEPELVAWVKSRNIEIINVSYQDAMNLGCNVVALGNERVMIPEASKSLKEKCLAQGLDVYNPDISMITPAGGGVHCLCQPLRRDPV